VITQEQLPMLKIAELNDMHLEEMLIINALESAARSRDIEGVAKSLTELYEHTKVHFESEDKMMQESEYKEFPAHKAEHDRHLHELNSLINYFQKHKEPNAIIAYIDGNLARWTLHHAQTMDGEMADFLSK